MAKVADGAKDDFFFHLVDEREQPVPDILSYLDNSNVPFTVQNFVKLVTLPRPRLCLLTMKKSNQQKVF